MSSPNVIPLNTPDSFPINDRECKVMIDEEPSCHKYLQKIGLRNFIKSISGIIILKNIPKMVSLSWFRNFSCWPSQVWKMDSDSANRSSVPKHGLFTKHTATKTR